MLLKKLAKLRRTILWCAVFAVSFLAYGKECDFYFNYNAPKTVTDYVKIGKVESSALSHGTVKLDVEYDIQLITNKWTQIESDWTYEYRTNSWTHISASAVPETGYHFEGTWYLQVYDYSLCHYRKDLTELSKSTVEFGYSPYDDDMPIKYSETGHKTSEWRCFILPTFSPNVYHVSFDLSCDASEATTPAPIDVTYDSPYGELPTPTRPNHTFEGWVRKYYDSEEKEQSETITGETILKTAADHTLYAKWKAYPTYSVRVESSNVVDIKYRRTDDSVDFDYTNSSIEVISNSVLRVWGTPKSDGYRLDDGSVAKPIVIDPVVSSQTIKLVAKANTYSVSFDLSYQAPETTPLLNPITVTYASSYGSLPTPTRVGYNFDGWYLGGTRVSDSTTVTTAADHELVARWSKKSYSLSTSVSPTGKGCSISRVPNASTYLFETEVTLEASSSSNSGYSFAYWEDDRKLGAVRSITIHATDEDENANAYTAIFTNNCYTVTFEIVPEAASVKPTTATTPATLNPIPVTYDTPYGELPSVSHIEYNFLGWFTSPTGGTKVEASDTYETAANLTLYARWEKLTRYAVTLTKGTGVASIYFKRDGEDSDWELYSSPVNVISKRKLSAYVVAEAGYTADYSDTVPFVSGEIAAASSFTLTAKPNTYTVTFDSCGGALPSGVSSTKEVVYDSTYGDLPFPAWSGHKFSGWFTSPTDGDKVEASTPFKTAANLTLYAHWEAFNLDLTAAADCVDLMLRSDRLEYPFVIDDSDSTVGETCVFFTSSSQVTLEHSTSLSADIEGSGKLSFDWRLQNYGRDKDFAATAELIIIDAAGNEIMPYKFTNEFGTNKFPDTTWESIEIELTDVISIKWQVSGENARTYFYLDNVKWIPEGSEKTELEKWAEYFQCEASEEAVAAAFKANCHLTISFDNETGKPIIEVIGLSDAELASKVKIECCEDLSNPTWIEHKPAQHSKCRFYRGTLVL